MSTVTGFGALETHLRARRDAGRKLLVPYVTGGLGADWPEVVRAFADGGADAIEIGIPFSDPVMDGPTIQEASQRALAGGATRDGSCSSRTSPAGWEIDGRRRSRPSWPRVPTPSRSASRSPIR